MMKVKKSKEGSSETAKMVDIGSTSSDILNKRKYFLAAAATLYAPVCTSLSRHLFSSFVRFSTSEEQTGLCPDCNSLLIEDCCNISIQRKPQITKNVRQLRKKSMSYMTSRDRRKLKRWNTRKCKVVLHCKTCNQVIKLPGPVNSQSIKSNQQRATQKKVVNQPIPRLVRDTENRKKMDKLKEMLVGAKTKKSEESQSPLLKFLKSI